jgi:hypothetical protein
VAAQTALVKGVLGQYVSALGARNLSGMRQVYPAMPAKVEEGFKNLFKIATDFSAAPKGDPAVTIRGADAEAQFGYALEYHSPSEGGRHVDFRWRAMLHRDAGGWRIQALQLAR